MEEAAVDEDAVYAAIAEELKTGATNEGLWTRLFAECNGDETRTKVAYIKHRAEKLIAEEQVRLAGLIAEEQARMADHLRCEAELESQVNETAEQLGISVSDASDVVRYGIERYGDDRWCLHTGGRREFYLYDHLVHAIAQAKRLRATAPPTPEAPRQLTEEPLISTVGEGSGERTAKPPGAAGEGSVSPPESQTQRVMTDPPPHSDVPLERPTSVAATCIITWILLLIGAPIGAMTLLTIPEDHPGFMSWDAIRGGLQGLDDDSGASTGESSWEGYKGIFAEPDARVVERYAEANLALTYSELLGGLLIALPLLLAASIGIYRGRRWGRTVLILYTGAWSSSKLLLAANVLPAAEVGPTVLKAALWIGLITFVLTRQSWSEWIGGSAVAPVQGASNTRGTHDMAWAQTPGTQAGGKYEHLRS